jgi:hypothetical protein
LKNNNNEIEQLIKEIKSMPEPDYERHYNHETQEKIYQNIMSYSKKKSTRKKYRKIIQPFILSSVGLAALLLFISIIIPVDNLLLKNGMKEQVNQEELEDFFHKSMSEIGRSEESYSIFYTQINIWNEQDGLVFFTERAPEELEVHMAYFLKEEGSWNWKDESGTTWKSDSNWEVSDIVPFIYTGALSDEPVSEVLVDGKKATIIHFNGELRYWYIKVDNQFAKVQYKLVNGDIVDVERVDSKR